MDLFFMSLEMRERVGSSGPLFHELEKRKRIKTPTGLFFTSLKIRERVGSGGPLFQTRLGLFFTSLEMRERVEVQWTSFS